METPFSLPWLPKGPKWMKDWWANCKDALERDRINAAGDIKFSETDCGRIPFVDAGGTTSVSVFHDFPFNPFQIISIPQKDAAPKIGVSYNSKVFKNLSCDILTISGLMASATPDSGDPGAFDIPSIGQKIWLQIATCATSGDAPRPLELTSGGSATLIKKGVVGTTNSWNNYPDPVFINTATDNKHFQEFYNLLLAEVVDPKNDSRPAILSLDASSEQDGSGMRNIVQMWSRNTMMVLWAVMGDVCYVPVDPTPDYAPT